MTDLHDPLPDAVGDPDEIRLDEGALPERITEIGAAERVDLRAHPVSAALGVLALVAVVVAAVFGIAELLVDDEATDVAEVVVPRLGIRPLEEAQRELERIGLLVDVQFEPNEIVPPDVVVGQEPVGGSRLEIGERVVLEVSDGPAGVSIPELDEVSGPEAVRLLSVLELDAVVERVYDEDVPENVVTATVPAGGARAQPGSTVEVLVSKGPEPRTVPKVIGLTSYEAFAELGRADLEVGDVRERFDPDAEPGEVLAIEPSAGAEVPRDQPIDVLIAGPERQLFFPDVVGLSRSSAAAVADSRSLELRVRTESVDASDPRAGRVIRQSPVAGSPADGGDVLTVTIAVAPPPPPPPPPAPSPGPTTTQAPPPSTTTSTVPG